MTFRTVDALRRRLPQPGFGRIRRYLEEGQGRAPRRRAGATPAGELYSSWM